MHILEEKIYQDMVASSIWIKRVWSRTKHKNQNNPLAVLAVEI